MNDILDKELQKDVSFTYFSILLRHNYWKLFRTLSISCFLKQLYGNRTTQGKNALITTVGMD